MGFFNFTNRRPASKTASLPLAVLHSKECLVCPLNQEIGLRHPKMEPVGSDHPLIYMLGEGPGETEDAKGIPFVGKAGRVLRARIPASIDPELRWNNCVRTRPPENRTPTLMEVEACRPSLIRDIQATKPRAIFGFGNVPLHWAIGLNGITNWNGRRIPIKVGTHSCWFFPMLHPSFILRTRKFTPRNASDYGSDNEFSFAVDLRNAFAQIDDLPEPIVHTPDDAFEDIEIVYGKHGYRDVKRVEEFLASLYKEGTVVGIDYETVGLRPYSKKSKILSVALSGQERTMAFALDHSKASWSPEQLEEVDLHFKRFLYNARCRKISHHLAFEQEWTAFFYGPRSLRAGLWGDSMSQAYILDERQGKGKPDCTSLEFLCIQYFGINVKQLSQVDRKDLDHEPVENVLRYNGVDARYHRWLYLEQAVRLKDEGLLEVYHHQLRRVPTVVLTQMIGVPVDQSVVQKFYKKYTEDLEDIEADIADLEITKKFKRQTGKAFRPSANDDVAYVVRKMLHEVIESTDYNALEKFDYPLTKLVLEWRETNKLLSTYVKPIMPGSANLHDDGLMHPILSLTKTRTWRTSSEDPNSQNWPKREHKEVRSQVRPGGALRVVSFDYGQIQARNVAMESKDEALVKSFWDRYDIHGDWMERIVRSYPKWVDGGGKALANDKDLRKKFRHRAKNELVFPSFFGAQPKSLAKYLGIPESICADLSAEFWDMFPSIKDWQKRITDRYYRDGYVTGLSGFRRRAPISSNELINAPIQADEALIVCDAMARLSELEDPRYQACMEIHDDLTFIWPKNDIERNAEVVIDTILDVPFEWAKIVPILVEMSVGVDWASGEEVGDFSSDTWKGRLEYVDKTPDPNKGSWSDGTGWENAEHYEKLPSHLRKERQ